MEVLSLLLSTWLRYSYTGCGLIHIQFIPPVIGSLVAVVNRVADIGRYSTFRVMVCDEKRIIAEFRGLAIRVNTPFLKRWLLKNPRFKQLLKSYICFWRECVFNPPYLILLIRPMLLDLPVAGLSQLRRATRSAGNPVVLQIFNRFFPEAKTYPEIYGVCISRVSTNN
jgi:hypothetical protein